MRHILLSLLAGLLAFSARAASPCDAPAATGHFILMNGMIAYCPGGGALPVLRGGTGAVRLPTAGFGAVTELNPAAPLGERLVLAGHSSAGLFRSLDGGQNWANVSGPGSGLEASSKNAGALLTARTAAGGTDVLVGMVGAANGGVYLSGNGGENWMQISLGFNPAALNIATLVKTSCGGCPVQYYTGSYGSGVYTRTIPVMPPPVVTGWCVGAAACACSAATPAGKASGGQPFKICGTGFQQLAVVEFGQPGGWIMAGRCQMPSAGALTCTATPAHLPGRVSFRVRNPDTRVGVASQPFTFNP